MEKLTNGALVTLTPDPMLTTFIDSYMRLQVSMWSAILCMKIQFSSIIVLVFILSIDVGYFGKQLFLTNLVA